MPAQRRPRPIQTAREAEALVRERKMVTLTGRSSLPCLAEAIAGRRLRGSWMLAPECHRIYDILTSLELSNLVFAPLILGKQTALDPSLGPALQRVAADPDRRARAVAKLPPLARLLLRKVEQKGKVEGVPRGTRVLLERALLVVSQQVHTEKGAHACILRPWPAGSTAGLNLDEAESALLLAAVRSAEIAPLREARKWFEFAPSRIDDLLRRGLLAQQNEALVCPNE